MVITTRATSFVPGPAVAGVVPYRHFGEGEDEHLLVWHGTAIRQNMPLIVYIKPGHTFSMGERVMDPHTSSSPALGVAVDDLYTSHNWPIVGLEYRPPFSADSPKREPLSSRPWPGTLLSIRKAMVYLREHWNDETLWGAGGSIDPNRIAMLGSSSGHTMAMLLALIPPSRMAAQLVNGLGQGQNVQDHRPNAVCGFIGQVDWTQWALDPSDTTGPFTFDVHQYFFGKNAPGLTNAALAAAIKRSASPWFWLPFLEKGSTRTAFWSSWGVRPGSGPGRNLTQADFLPNSIRADSANGKAFFDPHHMFQAGPWETRLKAMRARQRTIWGDNTDNPGGANNDNIGLNTTTTANDLHKFLTQDLGWPAVL